jgi:tetratricopeptide (TPR) repeat protein
MLHAVQQAFLSQRDPARMLRVLALLAAPVYNPNSPDQYPTPLDLRQEWHVLADGVRRSGAPILLARLTLPTLDALRYALSPRAWEQGVFPHVLHFSGHAWREGLLLEDELGQMHAATTSEVLNALKGMPHPLDLVVLNGCESAADAQSVAQALMDGGFARVVVGHERSVLDPEAVAFAARLYAELTGGFTLKEAVDRAQKQITTHQVVLLGDTTLCFEKLSGGEPVVNDLRPQGNLPSQSALFLGRGRELVEISRTLAHPTAIIVLSGPPGIGKTSLVLEAAHRNAWRFPGGVAYAAGPRPEDIRTATATEMLTALAGALGLEQTDDLARYTTAQPTLLLLDNLESLPPGELTRLRDFLRQLGRESAALLALRPSQKTLEDLPAARPMPLHRGLAEGEAARYAMFLAGQRQIPLTQEQARLIARAVDGHPLLVEQLVAQARRRDLDDLLRDISERHGDFAALVETVYAWSASRLDEAGLAAWAALTLFSAGCAPEGPLRAAAGVGGTQNLRECALADFDAAGQVWRWHATVAEYALGHWPFSEEERRTRLVALLPAWTHWLERQPAGERRTLNRLEESRPNLEAVLDACIGSSYDEVLSFLDKLDACLPEPERTLTLRELVARVLKAKLLVLPAAEEARRAGLLNNLGVALSALGRRADALEAAQEAVAIRRKLAASNPQAFLPNLAGSLNNLGILLSDLGRREDALAPSEESVDRYRKLAASNPQAFLPNLATSLGSFGSILQALEFHEEAARAFKEGLQHLVPFYRDLPQAFTGLAKWMVQAYLQSCREAGLEPDAALLSQFI